MLRKFLCSPSILSLHGPQVRVCTGREAVCDQFGGGRARLKHEHRAPVEAGVLAGELEAQQADTASLQLTGAHLLQQRPATQQAAPP